jgi:hypothetical protein
LDIKQLKQKYRIQQWAEVVAECQQSDMPVRTWCAEHGICRQTYYFWQKRVREAAFANALTAQGSMGIAPPVRQEPAQTQFVQIAPGGPARDGAVALSFRISAVECEIMNGADIDLVERALLALGKIC